MEAMYRELAGISEAFRQTPYAHYRGETIAPLSPETQTAIERSRQTGVTAPYFQQARNLQAGAAQPFRDVYRQYMNPYQQAVVNDIARLGERTLRENILPQLEAQFVGLGQQRSSRHDDLRLRAARDLQEQILREQGRLLASGYEQGAQHHHRETGRAAEAGRNIAELGRYAQASHLGDIESLMHAGQVGQQHRQNVANENRSEFLRQAYYPHQMLQQHAAILHGLPNQGITSEGLYVPRGLVPQVNTAGQVGSLAAQLYGASQIPRQFKKGGSPARRIKQHPFGLSELKFMSNNKYKKSHSMSRHQMKNEHHIPRGML
jgi:hypothetical protein